MKIWKKNLIAAAVLVAVCAGIYINWQYGQEQAVMNLEDTWDTEKLLSSDMLVMGEPFSTEETDTISSYFAAVRLSRQQARDSALSLLQETMSYTEQDGMEQNSEQLEKIVQTALCEAQIESLVIAKGYVDCVAYISDEGISVAVASPEGGMQESDVALIADIVMTQSGFTLDQIRIVEVQ